MSIQAQTISDSDITERLGPGTTTWEEDSANHVARYLFAIESAKGKRVLDAGCGLGYGSALLKSLAAREVVGIDIDEASVARARQTYPIAGLEYMVDNCEELLKVHGPFDVICNFENIEHIPNPDRFLEAASRLLADDGVFLCSTPDRANSAWENGKPKNPYHVNEWYRDEFAAMLAKSFSEVEIRDQVESIAYGRRQASLISLHEYTYRNWMVPTTRLARLAGRLLGKRVSYPKLDGLIASSPADYPIVPHEISPIMGKTICHYAICRGGRP